MKTPLDAQQRPYLILGGSVTGPSHLQAGSPCQDASGFQRYPSDMAVLCVADGAGSATHAAMGAHTAVAAVLNACASHTLIDLTDDDTVRNSLREVFLAARLAVEEQATVQQCCLRDLASTLIIAMLRHDAVAVGQIGDGAVVVEDFTGLIVLSPPEETEYTNETLFLTSETWEQALRIRWCGGGVNGVALFSDGCQRAALRHKPEGWSASPGFLGALFAFARESDDDHAGTEAILRLLMSEKVCEHCDDDKSLVVAVKKLPIARG